MPIFIKKIARRALGAVESNQDYDSIDALITNIGVIYALTIGFAIALQFVVSGPPNADVDFMSLLCTEPEFRPFVIDTMAEEEVGKISHETFNFTVVLGGVVFDVRKTILVDLDKYDDAGTDFNQWFDCMGDRNLNAATELMIADFPMEMMRAYILQHPSVFIESEQQQWYATMSQSLLFAGLISSLLFSVSLTISAARLDETKKALRAWTSVMAIPLFLNYVVLTLALILLFIGSARFLAGTSPYYARTIWETRTVAFYHVAVPVICICGLVGLFAAALSFIRRGEQPEKLRSDNEV